MSWWTYVSGVVEVEVPGRTQAECRYIVDSVLDHLPLVTGSEGCMKFHVIQRDGYNCSSTHDEFGMRTNNLVDDYGDKSRRHGFLQKQDHYLIVLEGGLRDREFDQTKHELTKWLCRLAKRLFVSSLLVGLSAYKKVLIFSDEIPFTNMYEWETSKSWTNYLMWERDPKSDLPLQLVNKYFDDKYVKDELKRREEWQDKESE